MSVIYKLNNHSCKVVTCRSRWGIISLRFQYMLRGDIQIMPRAHRSGSAAL